MIMVGAMRSVNVAVVVGLGLALAGCRVGPQYARPSAPLAPAFKEELPSNFKSQDGWKPAQPSDALLKGDWWTLFNDSQLNALEAQIDPANQTLKESEANFRSERIRQIQSRIGSANHLHRARSRRRPRLQKSALH